MLSNNKNKVLSVFALVMINIIAVDSLRTLPISAEYGLSLIFFYVLAALVFFLPTAFISAELATTYPQTGGIYVWVREAFGDRLGFLVIWIQWIYNIVWYPTILSFVASIFAYLIDPALLENKKFLITSLLLLFWGSTLVNLRGMKISSMISSLGSIIGTLLPMILIIILGIYYYFSPHPNQIDFSFTNVMPKINSLSDLVLLSGIIYGLVGLEMSAVHAGEVKNPSVDYPKALFISVLIILISLVLSSLSVAIVVPKDELSLVAGIIQAFAKFFDIFHLKFLTPVIAVLMIIGGLGSVATWIIGPTKGMMVAASDGSLPNFLAKSNKYGVPTRLLLVQGVIFTLLTFVYWLMPTVNGSYWVLTELTAQLSLIMYLIMFVAAIYLRYKRKDINRPYKIPGKNLGIIVIGGIGALTSLIVIVIGFIPPSHVKIDNVWLYDSILIGGILLFCCPPFIMHRFKKQ